MIIRTTSDIGIMHLSWDEFCALCDLDPESRLAEWIRCQLIELGHVDLSFLKQHGGVLILDLEQGGELS